MTEIRRSRIGLPNLSASGPGPEPWDFVECVVIQMLAELVDRTSLPARLRVGAVYLNEGLNCGFDCDGTTSVCDPHLRGGILPIHRVHQRDSESSSLCVNPLPFFVEEIREGKSAVRT